MSVKSPTNFVQRLWFRLEVLLRAVNLWHGTHGFTSLPKEVIASVNSHYKPMDQELALFWQRENFTIHAKETKWPGNVQNLPRHIQTFLTRARTGHIVTQVYLHHFHISDTPTCLWCNIYDEDLEHILLYWPSINHKRSKLKSSVPVEEETALQYILTTPKLWMLAADIYKERRSKYPSFLMKNKNWYDYSGL